MSWKSPRSTRSMCSTGWLLSRRHRPIPANSLPAGAISSAAACRFTLEDSIYIDQAEVGRGLGRPLRATLLDQCTELGYRQMVAVIGGSDTWPSIRLHAALCFTRIGILPAVGFKFGSWVDIVLMQRALGPGETTAPEISSIKWEGRS